MNRGPLQLNEMAPDHNVTEEMSSTPPPVVRAPIICTTEEDDDENDTNKDVSQHSLQQIIKKSQDEHLHASLTDGSSSLVVSEEKEECPPQPTPTMSSVSAVSFDNAAKAPSESNTMQTLSRPPNHNNTLQKDSAFDFDASLANGKRGAGYLASQLALSTPTDVFAAGCTLLQLCAIGNLQAVKDYIEKSFANVNFRDYDRRTALHVASSEGHLDVVKYLVMKGANINRSDRWGGSPLDDAHRHRHTDVARYLRSKGARTGSLNLTANLIAAAAAGDIEEVRMICGDGKNVSQIALDLSGSKHGLEGGGGGGIKSVLDASRGKLQRNGLDISEPTLPNANSVDINKGDYDKRTALHLAAGEGHLDIVQFLCKRGANVNVEDRWGGE